MKCRFRVISTLAFYIVCSFTSSVFAADKTNSLEDASALLFPEVKAIFSEYAKNKDSWHVNRNRILNIFKELEFTVTIDDEREFSALAGGLMLALGPDLPDALKRQSAQRQLAMPTTRQGWLSKLVNDNDFSPLPFDRDEWLRNDGRDRTRYRMFKDFKSNRSLIGMRVDHLITELGKPNFQLETTLIYNVGLEIGLIQIDYMTLDFEITDNKVVGYRFASH